MSTVKLIKSTSTANLDAYLEKEKEGNDLPRVLFEAGQHCRPETAQAEFRALRVEHGTQGAKRKQNATYVEPDDPAEATHLKVGKNWREAKPGEEATHQRIEPKVPETKAHEVNHWIVSFGVHEVNPDDPEAMQKAFDSVVAQWEQERPGAQAKFVAHGDALGSKQAIERGEHGKFHVHVMENATVHTEMEVGGRTFMPGMRTAGPLTNIDRVRGRNDAFLRERGKEYGLGPQILAAPNSKEAKSVRRTPHDFWTKERGGVSDQDLTREAAETALGNLEKDDLAGLDANQRLHRFGDELSACSGIEVKYRRVKSTGEDKIRSYVVPGRKQPISASRLGDRYTSDGVMEQLDLVEKGRWQTHEAQHAGPAKEITELSDEQAAQLQHDIDQVAQEERGLQEAEGVDAAREEQAAEKLAQMREADERAARDMQRFSREYGPEMGIRRSELASRHRREVPDAPAEDIERWADFSLSEEAARGELEPRLAELRRQREATVARDQETAPVTTPGSAASSRPSEGGGTKQQPAGAAKPVRRGERQLGLLNADQMRDVELIAVVRSERADGGAYVDFQVSADDPLARDQQGLHLMAQRQERKAPDGSVRRGVKTWHQLTAAQYDRIKTAGEENQLEVDGRQTLALRGNLMPSTRGSGYTVNAASVQPSQHEPIGSDVMDKQRASEDQARDKARGRDRERDAATWASERFTAAAERETAGHSR